MPRVAKKPTKKTTAKKPVKRTTKKVAPKKTVKKPPTSKKAKMKIVVKDVKKSFGKKEVLKGINLELTEGESLVILGGSGSGKSVLLKCILGLLEPDSGSIKVDGEEVTNLSERKRFEVMEKFGMLFQAGALFDSLPVWENITFGLLQKKSISRKDAKKIAEEKVAAVGLDQRVIDLSPSELSGGMQKRVSLARAIATEPEVIFFDEPTTGLDPIMCSVINDLIVKCVKEIGASAITITHDLHSARHIADHICMIYDGRIIWNGKTKELDKCTNPYVKQFIKGSMKGPIKVDTKAK